MTYISSQALSAASRQSVMQAQSQLANLQKELSSGNFADVGLQLGQRSGQLVSLTNEQNQLQAISDGNALTSTRLSATQTALTSLQAAASSFLANLTTASTAGNATAGLQNTASGNLAALVSTLNTSVGGQFIFAGINTGTQPMQAYTASPPSTSKAAVDSAFQATLTATGSDASTISGADMQSFLSGDFAALFTGADYSANWSSASDQTITSRIAPQQTASTSVSANSSAFQKLSQAYAMIGEYAGPPLSQDAQHAAVTTATSLVSSALAELTSLQAGVGVTQSAISASNDGMAAQISLLTAQTGAMNSLSDTQMYDLPNQVSMLQTQIQASYEVTAKLQQMSLVNYLS